MNESYELNRSIKNNKYLKALINGRSSQKNLNISNTSDEKTYEYGNQT